MFFYIGESCDLLTQSNPGLFLDKGWTHVVLNETHAWYKGYSTECVLGDNIEKILQGYKPNGIWAMVSYNGTYSLHIPVPGAFTLYKQNNNYTNLALDGYEVVPNKPVTVNISNSQTVDIVTDTIKNILIENCSNYQQPINIVCSGGMDSTSLIAICEYANIPYNIHVASLKDRFTSIRDSEGTVQDYESPLIDFCRKKYWAYEFVSIYKNPTSLTTGFYGDEFMCRNIWQMQMLANSLGTTLDQVLNENDYVYRHLSKPNFASLKHHNENISSETIKQILIDGIGRGQVWHIDNTETFCPYYDFRITQAILSLEVHEILDQGKTLGIQKNIISRCCPDVLLLVDNYKNGKDERKNFFNNIGNVTLKSCKKILVL
jgi:hypothetical protein